MHDHTVSKVSAGGLLALGDLQRVSIPQVCVSYKQENWVTRTTRCYFAITPSEWENVLRERQGEVIHHIDQKRTHSFKERIYEFLSVPALYLSHAA